MDIYTVPDVFDLVKGETYDPLEAIVVNEDNEAVDLSDVASVVFEFYTSGNRRTLIFSKDAAVYNATGGILRYTWVATDTNTLDAGLYYGRFKMTYSDSKIRYVPQAKTYILIKLSE